jgi:hypothetical protein
MDPQELRRKNNAFGSIVKDPKLARLYNDAMKSPPGSAQRKVANSTFSIIRRVNKSGDGIGGPFDFTSPTSAPQTSTPIAGQNFGNMMIFGAVPKFKTPAPAPVPAPTPYGSVGLTDGKTTTTPYTMPKAPTVNNFFDGPALTDGKNFTGVPSLASWTSTSTPTAAKTTKTHPDLLDLFTTSTPVVGTRTKPNIYAPVAPKTQPALLSDATMSEVPNTLADWTKRAARVGDTAITAIGAPLSAGFRATGAPFEALGRAAIETPGFNDKPRGFLERMRDTRSWQHAKELWNTGPWGKDPATAQPAPAYASPEAAQAAEMVAARNAQQNDVATATPTEATGSVATKGPSFYKNLGKPGAAAPETVVSTTKQVGSTPEFKNAIVSNEGSGSYTQIGKIMASGENEGYPALGKYQIMPNIWFKSIGLDADNEADVNKFLSTPELQDELFGVIVDDLSKTYEGDQAKMAAAYFGGPLGAKNYGTPAGDEQGDGNMSVNQYVASVLKKTGGVAGTVATDIPSEVPVVPPSDFAKMSDADKVKYAIRNNLGSDKFGLEAGQAAIGGTLLGVTTKYYEDQRKMAGLPEMELALSKMKADDVNFRQTIEEYMNGKDQVVSALEKEIAMEEKRRPTLDMMNPAVATQYNNHMAQLYALKGKHEQRYINYADNAVANFHADIARKQADIEAITNKVNELTATNSAITKEVYETTAMAMKGMYDTAVNAPIVADNIRMVHANMLDAERAQIKNAADGSASTSGSIKDYNDILATITTGPDKILNMGALTKNGIYGVMTTAMDRGQDITEAGRAMSTAIGNLVLSQDKEGGTDVENISRGKKLINDYVRQAEGTPGLEESAKAMNANFLSAAEAPYASYIHDQIIDVQGAIEDRMGGMDKAALSEKYPDLNSMVLDDIIDNIDAKPTEEFKASVKRVLLSGSPSEASKAIANFLTTKWS